MSTTAQDEFDQLFKATQISARHPEDQAEKSDASSLHSNEDDDSSSSPQRAIRSGRNRVTDDDDLEAIQKATDDKMRMRYFLPSKQHDANTGPKGVIADAYAFESARKAAKRKSFIPFLSGADFTPSAPPVQYQRDVEKGADDDEDDFMKRWRDARLKELENSFNGNGKIEARRHSPSGKRWGSLATVDAEGYLDAVEKSPRGVTVVVLIYDDMSDISTLIEDFVRQIARVHTSTRFVRLHYEEAEFEAAGVPAMIAYRNGEKFAGLVPIIDELPDQAEVEAMTLQKVMEKHQIL